MEESGGDSFVVAQWRKGKGGGRNVEESGELKEKWRG